MNAQVLARKWRPRKFKDLIGQSHVTQALTYALDNGRLHHAYLFTGTRGIGKTTIGRIIAQCLNCEQGLSAAACGQCSACVEIETDRFIDFLEIDAASKTKVDDTRDLLEKVMYAPTRGRYKIYLIDEVHMLSTHSFNALLKTLEEPPAHVIFILATTDPQKLPSTILSRCLQFQLKAIQPELLTTHLAYILEQEQITFDTAAIELLAHAAKGSVRDALSLLDQAIATGGGTVTHTTTRDMLGIQGQQLILPLAECILTQKITDALSISRQLTNLAANLDYILDQLIQLFHDVAIKQGAPDFLINNPLASEAELLELARTCDAQALQLSYQIALLAKRDLPLAPSAVIGFQMALLRMIAFTVKNESASVSAQPLASGPKAAAPIIEIQTTATPPQKSEPSQTAPIPSTPEDEISNTDQLSCMPSPRGAATAACIPLPHTRARGSSDRTVKCDGYIPSKLVTPPKPNTATNKAQLSWSELLPLLGLTALAKALAEHLHFERKEADHFYFSLEQHHAAMVQEKHRLRINEALSNYFERPIQITIQIGRTSKSAPSIVQERATQEKAQQQAALAEFEHDQPLQKTLHQFDGKMIPETLMTE